MKNTPLLLLALLVATGCSAPNPLKITGFGGSTEFLPSSGDIPGLVQRSKKKGYRGGDMSQYLGNKAGLYREYGANSVGVCDYSLGDISRTLTIEIFSMEDAVSSGGLFHFYRGRQLRGKGVPVSVGAEAVLDKKRESRNLYFYKNRHFAKVIYSGPEPVPDLVQLSTRLAAMIPGTCKKPGGFKYLDVEGVDATTGSVTPGYTFNCEFLPPSVTAKAPGAGSPVADVYLIAHYEEKEAIKTGRDYRQYLSLNGLDLTIKARKRRRVVWWARDPHRGRVVCTQYRKYVIILARPKTYAHGEVILNRIVNKIGAQ